MNILNILYIFCTCTNIILVLAFVVPKYFFLHNRGMLRRSRCVLPLHFFKKQKKTLYFILVLTFTDPKYFFPPGGIASSSFFKGNKKNYYYCNPETPINILNILYIFCTCTNIILVLAFITRGCSEGLGVF